MVAMAAVAIVPVPAVRLVKGRSGDQLSASTGVQRVAALEVLLLLYTLPTTEIYQPPLTVEDLATALPTAPILSHLVQLFTDPVFLLERVRCYVEAWEGWWGK
jgi:hypothetical protein